MLIKAIHRICNRLQDANERLCSVLGTLLLRQLGVNIGREVALSGLPIVYIAMNSVIEIGDSCALRSKSRNNAIGINHKIILRTQDAGAVIQIGDRTGISGASICAKKKIIIGNDCLIGSNVIIVDNDFHAIKPENRRYNRSDEDIPAREVIIGNNVWIGANSYIMKGVAIGDNSIIGAMSVVTKSVPSNCIAAGNPARIVRHLQNGMNAGNK